MKTEVGSPLLRVTELGESERLCWDEACVEVKVISCSWVAIRRWRCLLAEWLHPWLWSSPLCIPALACPAAKVQRAAKVNSFPPSAPIQPFGITCIWHWSHICQRPKPAQRLMANISTYLAPSRAPLWPSGPTIAEQHQSRGQIPLLHHKMNGYQLARGPTSLRFHLASWWCHK